MIWEKAGEIAGMAANEAIPPEEWDLKPLVDAVFKQFNFRMSIKAETLEGLNRESLAQLISDSAMALYNQRETAIGAEDKTA